jgi:hypothetical protein
MTRATSLRSRVRERLKHGFGAEVGEAIPSPTATIQKNIFHFRSNADMTRTKTRTARQSLWLTPRGKRNWKKAAAAGLNLNEFIRCCVERRAIAPVPPEVNRVRLWSWAGLA